MAYTRRTPQRIQLGGISSLWKAWVVAGTLVPACLVPGAWEQVHLPDTCYQVPCPRQLVAGTWYQAKNDMCRVNHSRYQMLQPAITRCQIAKTIYMIHQVPDTAISDMCTGTHWILEISRISARYCYGLQIRFECRLRFARTYPR